MSDKAKKEQKQFDNYQFFCDSIKEKIRLHELWIRNKKGGKKAVLLNEDLSNLELFEGAILSRAIFQDCDLTEANFNRATLFETSFINCELRNAGFASAYLRSADFYASNITDAWFINSDLQLANFNGAKGEFVSFYSGSERHTVYIHCCDYVSCGAFKGTLNEFEICVKEVYGNTQGNYKDLELIIKLIRKFFNIKSK